ncbi:MAG: Hsp33 family molecular chaperone HslO [Gammaproteobacteria bacterium]
MIHHDNLRRFIFDDLNVRGEWVQLNASWQSAVVNHDYPISVRHQLGKALAASVLLSSTIKFKGSLILQTHSDGILRSVVAQCTHDRFIRGLARCRGQAEHSNEEDIFGNGRLVLTIEPDAGEPYQGIVEMKGGDLPDALETYFARSEQLNTRLWLFSDDSRVAGLLIQELPAPKNDKDDWDRVEALANTVTEKELLNLPCEDVLYRLFHEEKIRVFPSEPVAFRCGCSLKKIEITLLCLGRRELEDILQSRGVIEVDCEFCNRKYSFDRIDFERIFSETVILDSNETRH